MCARNVLDPELSCCFWVSGPVENHQGVGLELAYFFFFSLCVGVCVCAAPTAYGGSQARGQIGATAASLHHSHSNARSEPRLWTTTQLTETSDS